MTTKIQHAILSFGYMGGLLVPPRPRKTRTEKAAERTPAPRKERDWPDT
jgi:hypothetical protein